jgi:hypothetical protein
MISTYDLSLPILKHKLATDDMAVAVRINADSNSRGAGCFGPVSLHVRLGDVL